MQSVHTHAFGILLRQHRRAAGLTQAELAERTGISVRGLSDMERGVSRWPHRDTVTLLAGALHIAPEARAAFEAAARRPRAHAAGDAASAWSGAHIPVPPTPLIGREHEEAVAEHLLRRDDVRLLTLIGPPGVGKTRLALRLAVEVGGEYRDDAWFVDLAAVRDAGQVLPTIAHVLGLRETSAHPAAEVLWSALRARHALLVLDNFEQVVDAATDVSDLLSACSHVKMLVTSRAPLRVRAEYEFAVPPLATPNPACSPPLDDLARYAAVALFVQRARAVSPAFELTAANAPAVVAICARLDGLPLAIELAAPRVTFFAPPVLLERLERRLPLLADGPRDLPERQRTLERAIAWSDELLDGRERDLFRHLAVFVGGWTLEAAEAISPEGDHAESGGEAVLRKLASLVAKSLVVREERTVGAVTNMRFRMLETVREYGLARLAASGDEETVRQRHANHFLQLAETAFESLRGPAQAAWLARLEDDHDNLRAALGWTLEHGTVELGLRLGWALYLFWRKRGHLREGQRWLEALLARVAGVGEGEREPGAGAGVVVPPALKGRALFALAASRLWQRDLAGLAPLEESLALFREVGDLVMLADALHAVGMAASELGDEARGTGLIEESLRVARSTGERWSIAQSLWTQGEIAYAAGQYVRAEALNSESLALFQEVGDVSYIAMVTLRAGYLSQARGDPAGAMVRYREALALARDLGETRGLAESLEAIASLLKEQGQPRRAVQFLSGAARLRALVAEPPRPSLEAALADMIVALRATLGAETFAAAWEVGEAASVDELRADLAKT